MLSFVRQAMKDMQHTGAMWPSGPGLASVMTRTLRNAQGPCRLLEVGPGTGAFTKAVLKRLRPGDEFVIVELSEAFCRELEKRLLAPFRSANPQIQVHLHCAPIESAPLTGPFDFIVCGLPFNNFPPTLVRRILRQLLSLLRSGGELAYFEYAGVRAMKGPLVGSKSRRELKRIGSYSKALRQRLGGRTEFVLGNFPPCLAVRLPAPSATSSQARSRPRRPTRSELKDQQRAKRQAKREAGLQIGSKSGHAAGHGAARQSGEPARGESNSLDATRKAAARVLGLASKFKTKKKSPSTSPSGGRSRSSSRSA